MLDIPEGFVIRNALTPRMEKSVKKSVIAAHFCVVFQQDVHQTVCY